MVFDAGRDLDPVTVGWLLENGLEVGLHCTPCGRHVVVTVRSLPFAKGYASAGAGWPVQMHSLWLDKNRGAAGVAAARVDGTDVVKIGDHDRDAGAPRLPMPDLGLNSLAGMVGSPNPKTYEALAWACHVLSRGANHFGSGPLICSKGDRAGHVALEVLAPRSLADGRAEVREALPI